MRRAIKAPCAEHLHAGIRSGSTKGAYICRLRVVRLTGPLERVLGVFLADPTADRYGYDLMKAAKLASGTLYPMLARLQEEGLLISEWEPQPTQAGGRPARRYYRLTGEGVRVARTELAQRSFGERRGVCAVGRPATGGAG